MKLDLQPGDVIAALRLQVLQDGAVESPGGERYRRAVREIQIAQHPTGFFGPRKNPKSRGIGHNEEVGAALHLRHPETAASGEYRKYRAMRGVFPEQRAGDGAAA